MVWFSICSAHQERKEGCPQCSCGIEYSEAELAEMKAEFDKIKTVCRCCGFEYCNSNNCVLCWYPKDPKGFWGQLFCGVGGHIWRNRRIGDSERRWYCTDCGAMITRTFIWPPPPPPKKEKARSAI